MIEQVLTEFLRSSHELAAVLTVYAGVPAVFYQKAPDDMDSLWENGRQFGRIVYALDLTGDPERDTSGILVVDVQCVEPQVPEEVEPIVRRLLHGRVIISEENTLSVSWRASNYFTEATDSITGVTVSFDLLDFPVQKIIGGPDPIRVLGEYVKGQYPEAVVIGYDMLADSVMAPTKEAPFIYCHLSRVDPCSYISDTYSCIWRTAYQQVHIMAGDQQTELSMAANLAADLLMHRRLFFPDKGPLMIDNAEVNPSMAPQSSPVISVTGTFGILRPQPAVESLNHIEIADKI